MIARAITRRITREIGAVAALVAVLGLAGCTTDATLAPGASAAASASASAGAAGPLAASADEPPPAPREYRGAWVATVSNIDWPSRPGLPAATQRAEALAILDRAQALGLNALILQVRPAGDAIYPSVLEPWSETLSGTQGRPPEPVYDPLAFWVEQAHRRGIELEAWFNPYRARQASARTPLVAPHLAVRRPGVVKRYGDQWWMDPGEPEALAQTLAVVADVVRRYDIDGVQIDDYFYPYPVSVGDAELPFPDDDSYARYRAGGGELGRDDWRRANVDTLVESLSRSIHAIKPWVRFGVSPFGIGRPDRRPPGVVGFSQYDKLYADVEHWLAEGWVDDLAPQLYWPIASDGQAFGALLRYWVGADTTGRAIWPGLYTSQVGRNWTAQELLDQVAMLRAAAPADAALVGQGAGAGAAIPASPPASEPTGHIHFSMTALMDDRGGLATALRQGPYAQPALVPAMPWLGGVAPPAPRLADDGPEARIEAAPGSVVARWAVWRRGRGADAAWRFTVLPVQARSIAWASDRELVVSGVGRTGLLSPRATLEVP